MINKPNDWDNVKVPGQFQRLPEGGYVIEIKKVEQLTAASGYEYLDLTIEICEGMFEGYYMADYKAQTYEPKRYKGHYRQGLPNTDVSKPFFKGMITAIEESNPGYTWDWNEQSLVGKKVGCLMRSEEWEYNGNHGMRTVPFRFIGADKIRNGEFLTPAPKYLDKPNDIQLQDAANASKPAPFDFEEIKDEDFPF